MTTRYAASSTRLRMPDMSGLDLLPLLRERVS